MKTDRIDARNLAHLHRAGELTPIRVPSPSEEALRDLVRVREDIRDDRRTTQHRVKSFLLRQGRRYPGRDKGWSDKFDRRTIDGWEAMPSVLGGGLQLKDLTAEDFFANFDAAYLDNPPDAL